jgi:hypothetical protein
MNPLNKSVMKKSFWFTLLLTAGFLILSSFLIDPSGSAPVGMEAEEIIESHCAGCHSDASTKKIAKAALNLDSWDDYRLTKKISKLGEICEEVEEEKMPPKKFLKSNPDKALNEAQKQLLCEWTVKESEELMKSIQ